VAGLAEEGGIVMAEYVSVGTAYGVPVVSPPAMGPTVSRIPVSDSPPDPDGADNTIAVLPGSSPMGAVAFTVREHVGQEKRQEARHEHRPSRKATAQSSAIRRIKSSKKTRRFFRGSSSAPQWGQRRSVWEMGPSHFGHFICNHPQDLLLSQF